LPPTFEIADPTFDQGYHDDLEGIHLAHHREKPSFIPTIWRCMAIFVKIAFVLSLSARFMTEVIEACCTPKGGTYTCCCDLSWCHKARQNSPVASMMTVGIPMSISEGEKRAWCQLGASRHGRWQGRARDEELSLKVVQQGKRQESARFTFIYATLRSSKAQRMVGVD